MGVFAALYSTRQLQTLFLKKKTMCCTTLTHKLLDSLVLCNLVIFVRFTRPCLLSPPPHNSGTGVLRSKYGASRSVGRETALTSSITAQNCLTLAKPAVPSQSLDAAGDTSQLFRADLSHGLPIGGGEGCSFCVPEFRKMPHYDRESKSGRGWAPSDNG